MGYPMTWRRVLHRNGLLGYYGCDDSYPTQPSRGLIAGDLRRLERDARDEHHLRAFADVAGVKPKQVKKVLDALFDGAPEQERA